MGLNESKGNMYDFVTHTWNTVKGECFHDCSYCYMKRWGKLNKVRFDKKELKTDLGENNFIFIGSSCDMFSRDIEESWINKTLNKCNEFNNKYLFQSKNPERFLGFTVFPVIKEKSIFVTTIESNRFYKEIMRESPYIEYRAKYVEKISKVIDTYVTIEPIMEFDFIELVETIKRCNPVQVNIGADSGNNNLPEPVKEEVLSLIDELNTFTKVKLKNNISRIIGDNKCHQN